MTHSRLPIAAAPAADETAPSYVHRLATLHGMPFTELWRQVCRPRTPGSTSRVVAADLLAAVTGRPEQRLRRAVVELRDPEPDWLAYRHEAQPGCPRCTARHPGGPVIQLMGHHRYVCTRHRLWLGLPGGHPDPTFPTLDGLPEVVTAQHAHHRLLRRLGPAATYDAVLTGFLICAHRWDQPARHSGDARGRWATRAAHLIPAGQEARAFSTSRLFAATYPEAVAVAALIGPLRWRRLAAGGPEQQHRFTTQIGHLLGDADYRPIVARDAIAHWIDSDCWQPPSRPVHTYRSRRTFGGPTLPKPHPSSAERNTRNAEWFAFNRLGGYAMLYHKHLGPVVLRDWATPRELFSGTVDASADTWKFRTAATQPLPPGPANAGEVRMPGYLRPLPAPSHYLDVTTDEPVPWPPSSTTTGSRDTGRPMHSGERKLAATTPGIGRYSQPRVG